MPSKYTTTSNVRYDENMHNMCVVASEGMSSLIALFGLSKVGFQRYI